jgi:hypothetical protein
MKQHIVPELKRNVARLISTIGMVVGLLTTEAALAVDAPYAENFDSYPDGSMPSYFTVQTTGGGIFYYSDWSVSNPTGSAGVYKNHAGGDTVTTASALEVTNVTATNFVLTTTFVVNSYGSFSQTFTDIHAGLIAFASGANLLSSGYQLSYELLRRGFGFPVTGTLTLSGSQSSDTLPVVTGVTYTMTLTGTVSSSEILLTGTLSDGSNSISVTHSDTMAQQGTYFGYLDSATGLPNQGAFMDVDYDNFSISAAGPNLVSAASVLTHGTAGTFAVDMPLGGTSGVEDRLATTYNAAFTFDAPVSSGEVTVLSGTATIGAITFSGNTMTVELTGVTPAEVVTLHAQNINGDGQAHGDVAFGFLVGDATANRLVGKADLLSVKGQVNQPVTSANFLEDINADGQIETRDGNLVRRNRGQTIP